MKTKKKSSISKKTKSKLKHKNKIIVESKQSKQEFQSNSGHPSSTVESEKSKNDEGECIKNHQSIHSQPRAVHSSIISASKNNGHLISTPSSPSRYKNQQINNSNQISIRCAATQRNKSYYHSFLIRSVINLQCLHLANLKGILFISMEGLPKWQEKRKLPSKYGKLRSIFKCVGKILKNFKYIDSGLLNAEILSQHLQISDQESKEIVTQGQKVYEIINNLFKMEEFEMDDVEKLFAPIIEWYLLNYGSKTVEDRNYDTIINDDIKIKLYDPIIPRKDPFEEDELENYIKKICEIDEEEEIPDNQNSTIHLLDFSLDLNEINEKNKNLMIEKYEDEFDDLFYYFYDEERSKNTRHKLFKKNPTLEEVINYNPNDSLLENEPFKRSLKIEEKEASLYEYKIDKNIKIERTDSSNNYYTAGAIEYLGTQKNYDKVYSEKIDEYSFNADDNQFPISVYNWKERAEIIDVHYLYKKIKSIKSVNIDEIEDNESELNKKHKDGYDKLVLEIEQDMIRIYLRENDDDFKNFIQKYNSLNCDQLKASPCVKAYRQIHNIPDDSPIYKDDTIYKKINRFKNLSKESQIEFLNKDYSNWGGSRTNVRKVTDETIICLITLCLDFPTLSTSTYVTYLNSKYGPNYKNNITLRTVERYLKYFDFNVKRASFAPPNRNYIGSRIFRVAWCMKIEDILKDSNVLFGFIDEAAVTTCEGKNHGRAFTGITPLCNCPLSKVKMSVIAVVYPGFGVIYSIIEKSVTGDKYAHFLREVNEFTRKYICNKDTEIVLIEDNCPIHCTENVEKTIEESKISMLPVVQYSPALNGVAEGYFGIVKTHLIVDSSVESENEIKNGIEEQWEYSTIHYFDDSVSLQLFREWRTRMQDCKKGQPMFSGHVSATEDFEDEIRNQMEITVDRLMDEIEIQISEH